MYFDLKYGGSFRVVCSLAALLLVAGSVVALGQAADPRVDTIRKIYADVNGRIAEMKKNPAESSIFAVEIAVNKYSAPYPAVGIYQRTATFYYTYGDREENPYPGRLIKIETTDARSAKKERGEYYFGDGGQPIFVFLSKEDTEMRLYFFGSALIRMVEAARTIDVRSRQAAAAKAAALKESTRLSNIFRAAIRDD